MGDTTLDDLSKSGWGSPVRVICIALGMFVLLELLWETRSILIATFLGILFAACMTPVVDRLQRWRIPRGLGAAALVLLFAGVLIGIASLLAPILETQVVEIRQRLPEAIDRIDKEIIRRHWSIGKLQPQDAAAQRAVITAAPAGAQPAGSRALPTRSPLRALISQQIVGLVPYLFPFVSTTVSALTGIILILFLAIFFASDPETYQRGLLHLVPHKGRPRAQALLSALGSTMRAWVVARLTAMITIGIVVTAVLTLMGVRAAVALGVIAGLLEFVPLFGPVLGAIPAVALSFLDSPGKALWVALAFVVIQQLEGNVLMPMLLQNKVEVPAALGLIGIASLGIVLGVLGVLVAEPVVASILVIVKMLYVEPVIGDRMMKDG